MPVWIIVVVLTLFHLLGLVAAYKAVMETRTSQGAIAWVIFLITFPYISLPVYWILGRNKFYGYTKAKHIKDERIQAELSGFIEGLKQHHIALSNINAAESAAQKLALLPALRGNNVTLLVNGEETFASIIEGLESAQHYILFQFYIVTDDTIGRKIRDLLVKKAREGVEVFFLYDEIGSYSLSTAYLRTLVEAGVQVAPFHTRKGIMNRFQINFRNHRKIVVVDGRETWIGGHNVGDEYMGYTKAFGYWRDTHVKIEGPAVMVAQLSFVEDWYWAKDRGIETLSWQPTIHPEDKAVLVVPTGPADELETAALMFHHAINSAQERIWIASPYFVPDDAIISALQLARLRGVDVRILIPHKADHLLVYLAAYSYFEELMGLGVRFFRYKEGFLHEKVMLVDNETATVGTANFDNRSFRLNFEITAVMTDMAFAQQIEKMFLEDFKRSYEMQASDIEGRSTWFRFATRLARLTAPIQ